MPDAIATPGAADANAFADLDAFELYCDARLNAGAWTSANDDTRSRALIEATRELSLLPWEGTRVTTTQVLAWPRRFAIDPDKPSLSQLGDYALLYFDEDVVPQRVQDATCELALQFLKAGTSDLAAIDPTIGVIRKKTDVLETEWASPSQRAQGLSRFPRVMSLIAPLLCSSSVGGLEIVRT